MTLRVLVSGDRNWVDKDYLFRALDSIPGITTIIEGEARGADSFARMWAKERNVECLKFPANWDKYHKAAGVIRNQQMLDVGKPDLVVAFHTNIAVSRGTKDMINRASKAGIRVILKDGTR